MDTDTGLIHDLIKHIFPEFSFNHSAVYKLLWRIEPKSAEAIIEESKLARATVYKILKELNDSRLIAKTNGKPVRYYASDPVKTYSTKCAKLFSKLEQGKEKIRQLIGNSSGLSGEVYLIKKDGGQCRLIDKETREAIQDKDELKEIKKVVEEKLIEAEMGRQKAWAVYR